MKRGRLPLTALRSFEAAGRHLSFSRAAEELFVSQAAISRQVRDLETQIGLPLFQRLHRRVELTDSGRTLLAELTETFNRIDAALESVSAEKRRRPVRLTIDPALAACWLAPRLGRFHARHPDIELELLVDIRLVDFRSGEADLGLRFSEHAKSWPHTETIELIEAYEAPMITPALLDARPLAAPADLRNHTLLHEESRRHWEEWFALAGAPGLGQHKVGGPLLSDPPLTRQLALLSQGVTLGDLFLLHDDLAAGDLVIPFPVFVRVGTYWIAAQSMAGLSDPARRVVEWLMQEAEASAAFVRKVMSEAGAG